MNNESIDLKSWEKYFKYMHSCNYSEYESPFSASINSKVEDILKKTASIPELDQQLTLTKISKVISKLKHKKACGSNKN